MQKIANKREPCEYPRRAAVGTPGGAKRVVEVQINIDLWTEHQSPTQQVG